MQPSLASQQLFLECDLTGAQFRKIVGLLHEHCGIAMRPGKEGLVRARLAKRLRKLGLPDFDSYLAYIENEPSRIEFAEMIDALTTNKTSFLRERAHFDFLRDTVLPTLGERIRIWSAGCSTGEEALTLAMLLRDPTSTTVRRDVRMLATDINQRVLAIAKAARYPAEQMSDVPVHWLRQYWTRRTSTDGQEWYEATSDIRRLVHFARLNLMDHWPMHGPFDAIFCRNVMIYFDKQTQQRLVERYWALLRPGGHLFVGHSESLTGTSHRFTYVQPAVYVK